MLTHVIFGTNDLDTAKKFYDAVLGTLGVGESTMADAQRCFYRHDGMSFGITKPVDGNPATAANGGTVGFAAESPEQVHAFHDAAIANGGTTCEDPPGLRPNESGGGFYLAYVRDPDGNKICALHFVK